MAYSDFTPGFNCQESQDAMQLKIWDNSTWNGESGYTTICTVSISFYDTNGTLVTFDDYDLIISADMSKFNEYLDRIDGHVIELSALTINGVPNVYDRFPEGYYMITMKYSEGSYAEGQFPEYVNSQAFLAKYRFMARRLPGALLVFPMTNDTYILNRDIFLLRMYLQNCEDAADYGKCVEFQNIINLIIAMLDYYKVEEPW